MRSEPCSWQGGPVPHMWKWFLCEASVSVGGETRWWGTRPGCSCPSPGNTLAASEAWSSPTNLRTAGLRQPGAQKGYHQGSVQEGCNWWLTGDRYRPLCSGRSRWGSALWGGILQWDREEPTDQCVGLEESGGTFWEQKVVLAVGKEKQSKHIN